MLTSRQIEILRLIVDDFINTGQPVGSRKLSKISELKVSSATIRNEMADLEDYGYILQPHISAGRVPSQLGFRYYVDSLLEAPFSTPDDEQIRSLYLKQYEENSYLLDQAASMISHYSKMTVLMTEPEFASRTLTNMKLLKMSTSKVLLVLITNSEDVKAIVINCGDLSQEELDALNVELLEILLNRSLEEIPFREFGRLKREFPQLSGLIDYVISALKDALRRLNQERIIVSGKENLLRPGYFKDMEAARVAIQSLKDNEVVLNLLDSEEEGLQVRIGKELGNEQFEDFSLVQSSYEYGGGQRGKLAILGPMRMDYGKILGIVEAGAKTLTDLFSGIHL